jgi:hypothetical protein
MLTLTPLIGQHLEEDPAIFLLGSMMKTLRTVQLLAEVRCALTFAGVLTSRRWLSSSSAATSSLGYSSTQSLDWHSVAYTLDLDAFHSARRISRYASDP